MRIVVVMGVAGAGKSTLGRALARALGWEFFDADDYHSADNVAWMREGRPLTEEMRAPWLEALRGLLAELIAQGRPAVLACSALTRAHRRALVPRDAPEGAVRFVHLRLPADVLHHRLSTRPDHFAPADLLESQLATLEEPADALTLDGMRPVAELVEETRRALAAE